MQNILEIRDLGRSYVNFRLEHISFSIPGGTIMGLVGENGAGKSTTIRAALGLIRKDAGEVLKVIRGLAEKDTTMIIVTHEMAFAHDVSDDVIFMDGGVIVEQGPPSRVLENPTEERTRQFLRSYNK